MTWNLDGKVVIVTGCSSGIGSSTAQMYLEAGATVFGIDRSPMPDAPKERFHFHQVDLTTADACADSVRRCLSVTGSDKVDVLANVAGVMDSFEAAHNLGDDAWERLLNVNATVPMRLMRAVLNDGKMLHHRSGRIINVASVAGLGGGGAGMAYTASKHALIGITKQSAWRYRRDGIRVNAVCPGGVATNISQSIQQANFDQESLDHLTPLFQLNYTSDGQMSISTQDVANAILFLSVDASRNVNGAVLPVDNAWSAI